MSSSKVHPFERKIQELQRQQSRASLVCPICKDEAVCASESKLREHATALHPSVVSDSKTWRDFLANASKQKHVRKTALDAPTGPSKAASDDSTRLHVGGNVDTPSQSRPAEEDIEDLNQLSLGPESELAPKDGRHVSSSASNPLKRPAAVSDQPIGRDGPTSSRNRRSKALSGGSFTPKDREFDRNTAMSSAKPAKPVTSRLFDPSSDPITASTPSNRKVGKAEAPLNARRAQDPRPSFSHPKHNPNEDFNSNNLIPHTHQSIGFEKPAVSAGLSAKHATHYRKTDDQPDLNLQGEPEPELLLQPETRPISHDQLVVEVKGIYAGLVMVEVKCIDVDDKQTQAALEKDPSRQTKLAPEQWQALIALHKTLLHEHHDFFLASQHPSASPALSRLAAKYSMPARMWRHGIHAFLEVLRHRLPDSLDHMLAFIYIAYSMMALLYETVPAFEDTWIECLGDLGRYRMAIEDDDIKDREVWSGVARFWYRKAADKSPNTGRLYHHLAILARPYTLQQLSLYTGSLTCKTPFENSKTSIMTLFTPILEGKESAHYRASSMEIIFIKAHALLFTGGSLLTYNEYVQQLCNGVLDSYIGRVTVKFKEQGVFAALSNISSLFEYGALATDGASKSTLRLAFEQSQVKKEGTQASQSPNDTDITPPLSSRSPKVAPLSPKERDISLQSIARASDLAFGFLCIVLLRVGDKNVLPSIHVYLILIYSMSNADAAMEILEKYIPWAEIATFLTSMAKLLAESDLKILAELFSKSNEGVGRPLPEDFVVRGQHWVEYFFPDTWFMDASIDDEERTLELPSFTAPRSQRMVGLGFRIAKPKKWLVYHSGSRTFEVAQRVRNFPKRAVQDTPNLSTASNDHDSQMTGLDDEEDKSSPLPDSPSRDPFEDFPRSEPQLPLSTTSVKEATWESSPAKPSSIVPTKILTKGDVKMMDSIYINQEKGSSSPEKQAIANSEEWLKTCGPMPGLSSHKVHGDCYSPDSLKVDILNPFEGDANDPTKV